MYVRRRTACPEKRLARRSLYLAGGAQVRACRVLPGTNLIWCRVSTYGWGKEWAGRTSIRVVGRLVCLFLFEEVRMGTKLRKTLEVNSEQDAEEDTS